MGRTRCAALRYDGIADQRRDYYADHDHAEVLEQPPLTWPHFRTSHVFRLSLSRKARDRRPLRLHLRVAVPSRIPGLRSAYCTSARADVKSSGPRYAVFG